jgi:uncharacterized protein (DUF4213/DUF364 family)
MQEKRNPWSLYDALVEGIPEDVQVVDYCFGKHWSYVQAECGMGVAFSVTGGAVIGQSDNLRGKPLKEVAELSRSWCFEDATLGMAAINAWFARREVLEPLGAVFDRPASSKKGRLDADGFAQYQRLLQRRNDEGNPAKVTVVGHFPFVERLAEYTELTVLERAPRDKWDTPDPACEFIVPSQDFLFTTGITLTNKTAYRLLELARDAHVIMLGPSAVMNPALFDFGIDMLAGSIVLDPEKASYACKGGANQTFGGSLLKCSIKAPGAIDPLQA